MVFHFFKEENVYELEEARKESELKKIKRKREQELEELRKTKKELEEAKVVLEIKVRARTRELREQALGLEAQIQKRTKDLEESREFLMKTLKETKKARELAEEERSKTLSIINNLTDGLLVLDKKGKISLVNPKAEEFFGIKSKDLIAKNINTITVLTKFKFLSEIFKKGFVSREEFKISEDLILEITAAPITSKKKTVAVLIILHNVTREKKIEEMKTEFVSLAAHQLRTPLSAIKWTLRLLLSGDLGKISKEQRDFVTKTYDSNERMISLVNDLLNVTVIEEGRYIFSHTAVNIEKVIKSLLEDYKKQIKDRKIKIIFIKEEKIPKVLADEEKICLAVENLLDNAVRYTKIGGEITISLNDLKDKKEIEFSIKDSGVGIPESQQKRIFSKFFRASNVIRMETEGTGLGLFITKNIINAHKGRIWFESQQGKGTTFHFTLPY